MQNVSVQEPDSGLTVVASFSLHIRSLQKACSLPALVTSTGEHICSCLCVGSWIGLSSNKLLLNADKPWKFSAGASNQGKLQS